jgi:hypothetical protein
MYVALRYLVVVRRDGGGGGVGTSSTSSSKNHTASLTLALPPHASAQLPLNEALVVAMVLWCVCRGLLGCSSPAMLLCSLCARSSPPLFPPPSPSLSLPRLSRKERPRKRLSFSLSLSLSLSPSLSREPCALSGELKQPPTPPALPKKKSWPR